MAEGGVQPKVEVDSESDESTIETFSEELAQGSLGEDSGRTRSGHQYQTTSGAESQSQATSGSRSGSRSASRTNSPVSGQGQAQSSPSSGTGLTPPHTPIRGASPPPTTSSSDSDSDAEMSSQFNYSALAKFCGNLPLAHPNRRTLMAYNVKRWLRDSENRIASKKLTSDKDKIAEAKLGVNPDIGDAVTILNSDVFDHKATFDEWKAAVIKLWLPAAERDSYLAVSRLLHMTRDVMIGEAVVQIEDAKHAIKNDMILNQIPEVKPANGWDSNDTSTLLVRLDDVLNYLGVGILYDGLTPADQEVFRELDFKCTDPLIDSVSEFHSKCAQKQRREVGRVNVVEDDFEHQDVPLDNQAFWAGPRGRGMRGRGRGRGGSNYRGQHSQYNKGNASAQEDPEQKVCKGCGKNGHTKSRCPDVECFRCNMKGHMARRCPQQSKDEKEQPAPGPKTGAIPKKRQN